TGPLAVSSANRSGEPTPATCEELRAVFAEAVAVYLCADAPPGRIASSVVDLAHGEPRMLRIGAVSQEDVHEALAGGARGAPRGGPRGPPVRRGPTEGLGRGGGPRTRRPPPHGGGLGEGRVGEGAGAGRPLGPPRGNDGWARSARRSEQRRGGRRARRRHLG